MYADRVEEGAKRSVKDRLNGNVVDDLYRRRSVTGKRLKREDDKWEHDLYEHDSRQISNRKVGPRDLRLKLQKVGLTPATGKGFISGMRDLREKLSGTAPSQPLSNSLPKPKSVAEAPKLANKSVTTEATPIETKKVHKTASRRTSQKKAETSLDTFLQCIGLEKYSITFQAEEVDMTALVHMSDDDLKALGIPMGPRKKIRLALETRA